MIYFSGQSADNVWKKASSCLIKGKNVHKQSSRNGNTIELLHVCFEIKNPLQRWVVSRNPSINPAFALAELVWIMNGSNDASIINHWNPVLPKYAGFDKKYHGAYGFRLRKHFKIDQLSRVYNVLKNNNETRQAVLQLWDPISDLPKNNGSPASSDIPCNISSFLKIRNNRLEWLQMLRSNDLFLGTPYNFVQFTFLQEIIAGWLGIEVGSYNQISDSLHIYVNDHKNFNYKPNTRVERNTDVIYKSKKESEFLFSDIFSRMKSMINPRISQSKFNKLSVLDVNEPAYQNILYVIASDSARRKGWYNIYTDFMDRCSNSVYKQLWKGWINRKFSNV